MKWHWDRFICKFPPLFSASHRSTITQYSSVALPQMCESLSRQHIITSLVCKLGFHLRFNPRPVASHSCYMLCPFSPSLFERSKILNYEWTGEWCRFCTRIREVLGSNLGRDTGNTDLFCWFSQYLQGKYGESTSIRQRLFSCKSFSISHSPIIAPFDVIQGVPGGEVIVSVILSKKVYMYMCPIPNAFRDRAARHVLTRVAKCIDVDVGFSKVYCTR
jgi:hypothetical protein